MGDLSLMAAAAFTPVGIFHHDPLIRPPKDLQALLPSQSHGRRQDILWQVTNLLAETNGQLYIGDSMIKRHALVDLQDQCTRHEKLLKLLTSGSSIAEDKDISLISDLMGFHSISSDLSTQPHVPMEAKLCLYDVGMDGPEKFLLPQRQLSATKSLLEFDGTLSETSSIPARPNGNFLFSGNGIEMKDLLSIVEAFDLSKNLLNSNKKVMVVPYFTWKRGGYARTNTTESISNLETLTDAPSKRSSKLKQAPKKNRKAGREKDMYSKNYFHACESLLNVYLDKSGDRNSILSLKNSEPELTQALLQFSAGIAGTGLAILLSVAFKSANGRVLPLSSAKLFNVSFGFGLFWLSWSVNRLQDTISSFSKKSNEGRSPDGEAAISREVERSVNDILFRAAALMAVAVLRLG